MATKKLFIVKFNFFNFEYKNSFKKPICLVDDYCDFLFNWSIETVQQFAKHLLGGEPTKFYISSFSEVQAITSKKKVFENILEKSENKKIDKLEMLSLIPFIVESDFETALMTTLNFFNLENENEIIPVITRIEMGLFLDSYFRSLHSRVVLEDVDEVYERTKDNLIRLSESDVDEILNFLFENLEEIKIEDLIK